MEHSQKETLATISESKMKKVIVTKSRYFRTDNAFILTVIKGQYIEKLEVIGQRNLDHDLGYYRAIGYQVSGDVK